MQAYLYYLEVHLSSTTQYNWEYTKCFCIYKFLSHLFAGITKDLIKHNDFPFNLH